MATIIKTRVGSGTPGNVLKRGELAVDPDAGTLHVGNVDDTSVTALVGPLADDGKWVGDGTNIWNANTGNVGIGTTTPSAKLEIETVTNNGLKITDGTVTTFQYVSGSDRGSVGTLSNHPQTFWANNAEHMRLLSTGELCVGRTTAFTGATLSVEGPIESSSAVTGTNHLTDVDSTFGINANTRAMLFANASYRFYVGTTERGRFATDALHVGRTSTSLTVAGVSLTYDGICSASRDNFNPLIASADGLGSGVKTLQQYNRDGVARGGVNVPSAAGTPSFYGNSDATLKTNIVDYSPTTALSVMAAVQPREFDVIEDNEHQIGFIAQEIEAIPELAHLVFNANVTSFDEQGNAVDTVAPTKSLAELRSVDAFIIGAIKELLSRVETLENP